MFSSLASYLWGAEETEDKCEEVPVPTQEGIERQSRSVLKTRPADDEWLLVDESKSRSRSRSAVGATLPTSSLENLLIEHPSMSVYQSYSGKHTETAIDKLSQVSEVGDEGSSTSTMAPPSAPPRAMANVRRPPRRKLCALAAAASASSSGVITRSQCSESLTRGVFQRANMSRNNKHAARRDRICQPYSRNMQRGGC